MQTSNGGPPRSVKHCRGNVLHVLPLPTVRAIGHSDGVICDKLFVDQAPLTASSLNLFLHSSRSKLFVCICSRGEQLPTEMAVASKRPRTVADRSVSVRELATIIQWLLKDRSAVTLQLHDFNCKDGDTVVHLI